MDFMAGVRYYMWCRDIGFLNRSALVNLDNQIYFNTVFACWFKSLCFDNFTMREPYKYVTTNILTFKTNYMAMSQKD